MAVLVPAPAAFGATFTVTGTGDGGTCTGTSCPSLRAAIAAAEGTRAEADTITVPEGVINIASDLVVQSEMTINGADARRTIVDGGFKYRLRTTAAGVLTLSRLTIRNGAAGGGDITDGGGIYNAGRLNLQDVRVTGSRAVRGGGIANALGLVVADNLLVDNNVATGAGGGGGILNEASQEFPELKGWLIVTDATIFKNSATGVGGVGGVFSTGTGASVSLNRSTIADNTGSATRGIGGIAPSGNTQATGSIVARNLAGTATVNCSDRLTSGLFSVEDETDCGLAPGNLKPQLATALSNQGGQLDVLTIPTASDAFNRMPFGDTPCEGTDQRGLARPQGAACDAGAFEIDQPATVTITEGPTGTITSTSTQFNFQADEPGVTVQCDLTGPGQTAGFETCYKENAQPYSNLADGPYTFSVRAVSASFPNPTPTTRTFVVNAAGAPNTTITGGPTGLTNTATPSFTFTSTEQGSTFQCRVDSAAFAACTSPHTTAALGQGAHTFQVRAIDAAGVVDATPASQAFTVDTVAPDTTITAGPTGTVASTSAIFTYSSPEPTATFQCARDGVAFGACPVQYTGLSQGAHTFQVRAVDAAGNADTSPAARTWTVDTVAPTVTIAASPARTNDTTPTFTFSTNEGGATTQCRLDGGAAATCASPYTTVVLAEGSHTLEVRATDAAGNLGTASRTIVIDTTAPAAPTITAGPTGPTNDNTPTFAFTGEAGASFECRVDSAAFECGSPFTPAALADGPHVFTVKVFDVAGNVSESATRTFTVDTTQPAPPDVSGPSGATTDPNPAFAFTAAEPTVECRLDGPGGPGAFGACASPKAFNALAPGDYVFLVRTTDAAGNQSTTERAFTVTQVQQAQPTPQPTVGPAQTPTPTPTPVPNQVIVVAPAQGTVLVKATGETTFTPLDVTKGIPNGSEVDVRKGRVTLTSIPKPGAPAETADFYGGMFIVTQKGGITDLKLSEPLNGCPKGQRASAAATKKKSRKLWGDGKGAFRTSGKYSAATVRGTIWLVQDTCTTTLTRVNQGVVSVRDFVKGKTVTVRKGKPYTARAKKR